MVPADCWRESLAFGAVQLDRDIGFSPVFRVLLGLALPAPVSQLPGPGTEQFCPAEPIENRQL